ncbi:MAG: DNA-directed RNA polymerase subunit omega [Ruminococcaceae bacterium]|nr:DNA-directed RNA polymerase subunit omega [Oscillospiraceae bacterium]
MIYPSIDEITKGQYNRYTLCIATAKCARIVTDEYVEQRELAEKMLANKETDKSLASMIKREIRDEKAVKTAIKRLYNGEFVICEGGKEEKEESEDLAQTIEAVEAAAEAAVSIFEEDDEDEDEEDEEELGEETEEA